MIYFLCVYFSHSASASELTSFINDLKQMQVCMIGLSNKARTGSSSDSSIHNLDDFTVIFFSRCAFKITQKSGKISILTFFLNAEHKKTVDIFTRRCSHLF